MTLFTGAGVALITPFHEDKSIHFEVLGELVEWQIAEGTDAIIVCGTTGEPSTMTKEERLEVISYTVQKAAKRIPIIAGTGGNNTKEVIKASLQAQKAGADGLLIVTPYYNKATQNGLYEHYAMIAQAVTLPIIMYNVPSRTGCNLLPQTAARLGRDFDHIVGIKEASGNISQVAKLSQVAGNYLDIYSGNDDQILPVLSLGGKGVISVLSNVIPKETHMMVAKFMEGDIEGAKELQLEYLELIDALFCEVNPIPVKAAMKLMGYAVGGLRLPLTEIEKIHQDTLKKVMEKYDLL